MTQPSAATAVLDLAVGSLDPTPDDDLVVGTRTARLRLAGATERVCSGDGADLLRAIEDDGFGYVGVDVPADRRWLVHDLQQLGFGLVEQQLTFTLRRLHRRVWPEEGPGLEIADEAGIDFACSLAADAFHFGRYHADPVIDRARLADRYPNWIRSAHRAEDTEVLIFGHDQPIGFLLVQYSDQHRGQLLLGATDAARPGPWGLQLYRGALQHLQQRGCRAVTAVVAVDNTSVVNVLIELGFNAGRPLKLLRRLSDPPPPARSQTPTGSIELT